MGSPNQRVNSGSSAPRSSIVSLTSKMTARFMAGSGWKIAAGEDDQTGDRGDGADDGERDQVRRGGSAGDERLGGVVVLKEREELDRLQRFPDAGEVVDEVRNDEQADGPGDDAAGSAGGGAPPQRQPADRPEERQSVEGDGAEVLIREFAIRSCVQHPGHHAERSS